MLTGKLGLHEFAFGTTSTNPHFGAVHNPWDTACVPGGSSGGSAGADYNAFADRRGFEGSHTDTNTIVSRLVGDFDGWDGDTIFTLENGMIWKQNETDTLSTRTMVNPVVTIKSGMFDTWRLSVEDYNKSLKVVRIQ